jgi:hypothetical protein
MILIIKSVTFRRVLVIFVVGLVSRGIVNWVGDINVFKEYTNIISIIYYGLFACFTGLVYEYCGEGVNSSLLNSSCNSLNKFFSRDNGLSGSSGSSGLKDSGVRVVGRPSAGLRGLYGDNMVYVTKNSIEGSSNIRGDTKYSFGYELKCKVY